MRSIRTKHMLLIVCAIVVALGIATLIGALSIKDLGKKDTDKNARYDVYYRSIESGILF